MINACIAQELIFVEYMMTKALKQLANSLKRKTKSMWHLSILTNNSDQIAFEIPMCLLVCWKHCIRRQEILAKSMAYIDTDTM